MELCDRTASELARLLQKREVSSREITESVFRRMDEREEKINAYITRTRELALKLADQADRRYRHNESLSPLDGIPVAFKDILCTKGIRTTCGSLMLRDYIPPYDATAVEKVLKAGAVLVGKTNMDEFAMGSSTENSAFGPTRNPLDPERVAGGSSGGSAAAVAAGEAIVALGSDTGGSIRLPAAFCGIAGIKPTYGRISRYGLVSYASSLDQVGVLGKSVEDCALMLGIVSGHDKKDATSAHTKTPDFLRSLNKGLKGLRIGLPKEYFVEGLDPGIKERIMAAVSLLEDNGVHIVEISLPHTPYAVATYYLIATAEASSNLARYDGVKFGFRTRENVTDSIMMYELTRSRGLGKEVKRRIMLGTYVLSAGYYDAYYLKAQQVRALIKADFDKAFEEVDCMVTPVSPCLPFRIGEKITEPLQMYLVDIYTASLNLSGLPGMSINCGTIKGLPAGMQIIGKAFDEETVLRVAYGYEKSIYR
ncbi:MAG: Asp-tRNA(Asn)/Glu-tRNA(Gln) amidotransferase subunit GatA [Deltaproteobacteria bacterium]|nr:Asp-tRNA(Asn)/Glu-tRNA(Gln) amidotransferase subunit GatA [Deltaproteobacteria bacterium]